MVDIWLETPFEGDRHERRLTKIARIEEGPTTTRAGLIRQLLTPCVSFVNTWYVTRSRSALSCDVIAASCPHCTSVRFAI